MDRVFHQLVDPGKLPVGVKGEMKLHSDRIHRIWLNQEDLGNDYVGIVNAIAEMLTPRPEETPAGKGVTVSGYEDLLKSYRRGGNEGQVLDNEARELRLYPTDVAHWIFCAEVPPSLRDAQEL